MTHVSLGGHRQSLMSFFKMDFHLPYSHKERKTLKNGKGFSLGCMQRIQRFSQLFSAKLVASSKLQEWGGSSSFHIKVKGQRIHSHKGRTQQYSSDGQRQIIENYKEFVG